MSVLDKVVAAITPTEHVRGAVMHHMYSEEDDWLVDLAKTEDAGLHSRLSAHYAEEFNRYMGPDAVMS